MKIKDEFALRKFADKWVAVSVNDDIDKEDFFITLNSSGVFLWNLLQDEISYDELLSAAVKKYGIDASKLKTDLDAFLQKIRDAKILSEWIIYIQKADMLCAKLSLTA